MNISETTAYISKLSAQEKVKTNLAFILGQAYTLQVLSEVLIKNGLPPGTSVFHQAARELIDLYHTLGLEGEDVIPISEYMSELSELFGKQARLKEARISFLD
jgi:hypothetical protein